MFCPNVVLHFVFCLHFPAWTDTDDTETTKESEPNSETVKDSSYPENNPQKGSLISVREAEESNRDSYENEEQPAGPSQTNGVHADVPMTTDTEVLNGTDETDSQASLQSATRRRIKRNTVVPTDTEDSGRQTPESEARKGVTYSRLSFSRHTIFFQLNAALE